MNFTYESYRNPFKDAVMYFVPIAVGVVAWLAAYIINSTCGHSVCTVCYRNTRNPLFDLGILSTVIFMLAHDNVTTEAHAYMIVIESGRCLRTNIFLRNICSYCFNFQVSFLAC
jgi:hypothetical protein